MFKIVSVSIFFISFNISFGQLWYYLEFGRSASAIGTAEQNITLLGPVNAMAGNPANLTFESGATVSFFRNPSYFFLEISTPVTNVVGSFNYKNKHFFGVEYSTHYLGKLKAFDQYGHLQKEYEDYEQAFSFGYAQKLNDKLSLGTKITYAITRDYMQATHLMISAGLSYNEKLLGRDLNLGMSLMYFGDKVKVKSEVYGEYYGENPSLFLLGFNYNLLSFYPGNVNSLIEFRKGLISYTNGVPDNSFKSLFKSWKYFNRFLETKVGIVLSSNSVQLSNRLNFNTDYFLGFSTGKYSGEYYNYGMKISLSYLDYSLALGFGGRLFSAKNILSPQFYGYETFDITLNKKINWYNAQVQDLKYRTLPVKKFNFNFGISKSLPLGIWKKNYGEFTDVETENFSTIELDLEFKLGDYFYNTNTLAYWKSKTKIKNNYFRFDFDEEAYAILTGIGFYPFGHLNKFYLSTSVGILRLNPISPNIYPKYSNLLTIVFSSGYKFDMFYKGIQIIPYVNLQTFFREALEKDELYGYKKFDYGLKLGYEF